MKFLMLIKHAESYRNHEIPKGLLEAMGEFVRNKMKSGELLETAGLKPTTEGARVRLNAGKISITDGPFTETKEITGGYAMLQAKSRGEALELARQFMDLHRIHWPAFVGECELRPLEDM